MANSFFSHIASLIALAILWSLNLLLLWGLNRQWWRLRRVRRAALLYPLAGLAAIGLWALGTAWHLEWLILLGARASAVVLTVQIALVAALPVSGLLLSGHRAVRWAGSRRGSASRQPMPLHAGAGLPASSPVSMPAPVERVDRGRRSFVTTAAAAIPGATLATSGYGLISSQGSVRMREVPLLFPRLHPDLQGLRVLHLTDIHLGYYVGLDDLENLMIAARSMRPDIVLVSGDIADDLAQLPGALKMIDTLRPRYGTFASLGNHEYFRGIENVLRIIDAGPIPLLRDTGAAVKVGRAELYIGGADDPQVMAHGERNYRFLERSVASAFDGAPSDAFHILMSHRPEGFDIAAEQGIPMTVSGHTHGAQVGFNGRSIFEPWMRDRYLWGHYEREGSQLYTSSGVGHWFPFRLGCPPEAPVYVLGKG
jgi:predicted MPP superfamily phosphohydrolase